MSDASPLEQEIRDLIARHGPISVSHYMDLCLAHPQYGYYVCRDPIGASGDFITAPEISQMFGELIGLWMTAVWRLMGSPAGLRVVELGPGRGTLMADAMRAAQAVPPFVAAIGGIHLVEINAALRARQADTLARLPETPAWHTSLAEVPDGPTIIIANEFFDALPVHQAVKQSDGWHERMVHVDADGNLGYTLAQEPIPHFERLLPKHLHDAHDDELFEWRSDAMAFDVGKRIGRANGAALIIDYGHIRSDTGDTLQAAARHAFTDPLHAPGMADLTAHVDFQALGLAVSAMGAAVHGPIGQGEWLRRLGIVERAQALKAHATAAQRHDIDTALDRLTGAGRTTMGELFKVVALADPRLGPLPGFDP
ncbi:MAG: class I SAM-dependent methyltransferase [Pseudolabrys sp.]